MKRELKTGISLMILVITIIVTIILAGTVILTVDSSSSKAKLVSFAEELMTIEDQVVSYYVQNDTLPIKDGTTSMTEEELLISVGESKAALLKEEIDLNYDTTSENNKVSYYYIDPTKLDITSGKRGLGKSGNIDVYVVSYPSLNVYYLQGIVDKSTWYFSLTSKLINKVNIQNTNNMSGTNVSVQSIQGLTVKRINKEWTNKLDITIEAYLEQDEEIYMSVQDGDNVLLNTTKNSKNRIEIDSFETLNNSDIVSLSIPQSNIQSFNNANKEDRKIEIIKYKNGNEIGRVGLKYPNYDINVPYLEADTSIKVYDNKNVVTLKTFDESSGIDKVTYEYLKEYDENANIVNSQEGVTEYTSAYMHLSAKEANVSSAGYVEIPIPKYVEGIQICIFDKAGNYVSLIRNTSEDIYSDIKVISNQLYNFVFNLEFAINTYISSYELYFSTDNINYTGIYSGTIDSSNTPFEVADLVLQDEYIQQITDKLFIKIVASDNSDSNNIKKYTRVIEYNIDENQNIVKVKL